LNNSTSAVFDALKYGYLPSASGSVAELSKLSPAKFSGIASPQSFQIQLQRRLAKPSRCGGESKCKGTRIEVFTLNIKNLPFKYARIRSPSGKIPTVDRRSAPRYSFSIVKTVIFPFGTAIPARV
jgi:hypothetical protein